MKHLVVLELPGHHEHPGAWAWCEVGETPGFQSVTLTEADGITPLLFERVPSLRGAQFLFAVMTDPSAGPSPAPDARHEASTDEGLDLLQFKADPPTLQLAPEGTP